MPNERVRAENKSIFPARRKTISETVKKIYIRYNIFAVDFTFGASLLTFGPGLSAFIKNMLSLPDNCTIAIKNTSTPIPPIQCVKLRQKISDFGNASTSVKMDAPVVVNPETVSKTASAKSFIYPENTNGNAPKILITIQLNATVTNPSFAYIALFFGALYDKSAPTANAIPMQVRIT